MRLPAGLYPQCAQRTFGVVSLLRGMQQNDHFARDERRCINGPVNRESLCNAIEKVESFPMIHRIPATDAGQRHTRDMIRAARSPG